MLSTLRPNCRCTDVSLMALSLHHIHCLPPSGHRSGRETASWSMWRLVLRNAEKPPTTIRPVPETL